MDHASLEPTQGKSRFIEKMGLYYENYGIPRIGGKILGLLLTAEKPVSAEQMSKALKVSRSSVSTNIRVLAAAGLLEVSPPEGSRTDYFTLSDIAWDNSIRARIQGFHSLRLIIEQGIASFGKEAGICTRLEEMMNWTDTMIEGHEDILSRWKTKRGKA